MCWKIRSKITQVQPVCVSILKRDFWIFFPLCWIIPSTQNHSLCRLRLNFLLELFQGETIEKGRKIWLNQILQFFFFPPVIFILSLEDFVVERQQNERNAMAAGWPLWTVDQSENTSPGASSEHQEDDCKIFVRARDWGVSLVAGLGGTGTPSHGFPSSHNLHFLSQLCLHNYSLCQAGPLLMWNWGKRVEEGCRKAGAQVLPGAAEGAGSV